MKTMQILWDGKWVDVEALGPDKAGLYVVMRPNGYAHTYNPVYDDIREKPPCTGSSGSAVAGAGLSGFHARYMAKRPLQLIAREAPARIDGSPVPPILEVEELWPSAKCPLCLDDTPHAHTAEDLAWLQQIARWLEQKLGAKP